MSGQSSIRCTAEGFDEDGLVTSVLPARPEPPHTFRLFVPIPPQFPRTGWKRLEAQPFRVTAVRSHRLNPRFLSLPGSAEVRALQWSVTVPAVLRSITETCSCRSKARTVLQVEMRQLHRRWGDPTIAGSLKKHRSVASSRGGAGSWASFTPLFAARSRQARNRASGLPPRQRDTFQPEDR